MSGEQIQVGEAILKVKLDIQELQANIAKAKANTNSFVSEATSKLNSMKLGWMGLAAGVGAFVIKSVNDYAKLDKAISNLVATTKRYTKAQGDLRGQLSAYLDKMEAATRFQDTELADSLNELVIKTKNLTQAIYLNNLAADLAVRKNMSLQAAAEMLGNLYVGNTRGLAMVAKELGVTGEKADDAAFLFNKLVSEMQGAAEAESNLALDFKKVRTEFENVGEVIAQKLAPAISFVAGISRDWLVAFQRMVIDATSSVSGFFKVIAQGPFAVISKFVAVRKESLAVAKEETKTQAQLGAEIAKQIQANKDALDLEKSRKQEAEEFWKEEEEAFEMELKAVEELEAQYERFGDLLAGSVTGDMEAFFTMVKEGNADIAQTFEALGNAMIKAMARAIAKVLEMKAAEHFVEAIGSAASYDFLGAGMHAAAGAAYTAAAGGIQAIASGLKDGAMITGGTTQADTFPAMLRKNEAAVPLDDPRAVNSMVEALKKSGVIGAGGNGGNSYQIGQVVVPGASTGAARSAALQTAYELDKVEQRKGRGRTKGRR